MTAATVPTLTDDEIDVIWEGVPDCSRFANYDDQRRFARAVLAAIAQPVPPDGIPIIGYLIHNEIGDSWLNKHPEPRSGNPEPLCRLSDALRSQPVPPAKSASIEIDFKQATELLQMFVDQPTSLTLTNGDGHSGKGLYAHYTEIPEDGAEYLGETDDEAIPIAQPVPRRCQISDAECNSGCSENKCKYGKDGTYLGPQPVPPAPAPLAPEDYSAIRAQLCEAHPGEWLHHYGPAVEAEVLKRLRAAA